MTEPGSEAAVGRVSRLVRETYEPRACWRAEDMIGARHNIDHVHPGHLRLVGPAFSVGVVLSIWRNGLPGDREPAREGSIVVKPPMVDRWPALGIKAGRGCREAHERALTVRCHDRQPAGEADRRQWQVKGTWRGC